VWTFCGPASTWGMLPDMTREELEQLDDTQRHDLAIARWKMRDYLRTMTVDEIEGAIDFTEGCRSTLWEMESLPVERKRRQVENDFGFSDGDMMCDNDWIQ
jgi:hypothetical protein